MRVTPCPLKGMFLLESTTFKDDRGSFTRLFCTEELKQAEVYKPIVQINTSCTYDKGTIRGMHFQYPPHAEYKIVRCIQGRCFDVAVDLRKDSLTFLHWYGEVLSAENERALVIPEGFAHGFQTMERDTRLLYFHTAMYTPESEGGVLYNDQAIDIDWPLPPQNISERDLKSPLIDQNFSGINI
ncbi:dTDP-4-dehydrorhamnose 3,5-epimerase [Marinifilum sp. JC120]|nr:dTDP-4-dehydrorhamnose 3,5-epimerase [Marinifilum sp. JC120]